MSRSRLFPELNLLETKAERRKVHRRALKRLRRRPRFWINLTLALVSLGATAILAVLWLERWFPMLHGNTGGIAVGIIGGTFGVTFQYVFRKPLRKQMRLELAAMGIPVCIACGYDLRGQREPRCPECGRPFDAKLITSKPD